MLALFFVCFGSHGIGITLHPPNDWSNSVVNNVVIDQRPHGYYESYINVTYNENSTCLAYAAWFRNAEKLYQYTVQLYPIGSAQLVDNIVALSCRLHCVSSSMLGTYISMVVIGGLWLLFPFIEILLRLLYVSYTYCETCICSLIVSRPRYNAPSYYRSIQDNVDVPPKYVM